MESSFTLFIFHILFDSIHAPTQVRQRASTARCVNLLFQSTHHTGCDVLGRSLHCNHAGFNPRTHTGCDSRHLADHCGCCRFNPRAHTGCDRPPGCITPSKKMFQSTHPHGVRLIIRRGSSKRFKFQSTHPHGVRPAPLNTAAFARMFQSTHPHGVRRICWA